MDIEWISLISLVENEVSGSGILRLAMKFSNACPASWVRTPTSAAVPLKFEKMNGAFHFGSDVQ